MKKTFFKKPYMLDIICLNTQITLLIIPEHFLENIIITIIIMLIIIKINISKHTHI